MTDYVSLYDFLKIGKENGYKHFSVAGMGLLYKDLVKYDSRFVENPEPASREAWVGFYKQMMLHAIYRESNFFTNEENSAFIHSPQLLLKPSTTSNNQDANYKLLEGEELYFNETMRNLNLTMKNNGLDTTMHEKGDTGNGNKSTGKSTGSAMSGNAQNLIGTATTQKKMTTGELIKKSMTNMNNKWDTALKKTMDTLSEELRDMMDTEIKSLNQAQEALAEDTVKNREAVAEAKEIAQEAKTKATNLENEFNQKVEDKVLEMVRNKTLAIGNGEEIEPAAAEGYVEQRGTIYAWEIRRYFTQAQLARADYRAAVFKMIDMGMLIIRIVKVEKYIEINGENFKAKQKAIEEQITQVKLKDVKTRRFKNRLGEYKYVVEATVDAIFRFRSVITKRILADRNKHKGELGINLATLEGYNIDGLLNFWKNNLYFENGQKIISKFDYTRMGFLVIYLNDASEEKRETFRREKGRDPVDNEICTRILPNCPRLLAQIESPTYDDLCKVADFKNYFVFNGGIYDVPKAEEEKVEEVKEGDTSSSEESD